MKKVSPMPHAKLCMLEMMNFYEVCVSFILS